MPVATTTPVPRAKAGSHSTTCCSTISSSGTGPARRLLSRTPSSRCSTTVASRSTWASALPASSRTVCWSSACMISSSRIDSAVSGVRSWCDASLANCRSAAISRSIAVGAALEQLGDPVDLGDAGRRAAVRGSDRSRASRRAGAARPAARSTAGLQQCRPRPPQPARAPAPTARRPAPWLLPVARPARRDEPSGTPSSSAATTATATLRLDRADDARHAHRHSRSKRKPTPRTVVMNARVGGVVAELLAQPGDVHVQRLGRAPPGGVPDLAHQLLAGDDLAVSRSSTRSRSNSLAVSESSCSSIQARCESTSIRTPVHALGDLDRRRGAAGRGPGRAARPAGTAW